MKKCPKCKADIDDNARFCVFCMTSFEEKNVITNKTSRNNKTLLTVAVVLAVLLSASVVFMLVLKPWENKSTDADETLASTVNGDIIDVTDDGTKASAETTGRVEESASLSDLQESETYCPEDSEPDNSENYTTNENNSGIPPIDRVPTVIQTTAAAVERTEPDDTQTPDNIGTQTEPGVTEKTNADTTEEPIVETTAPETVAETEPIQTEEAQTTVAETEPVKVPEETDPPIVSVPVSYSYVAANSGNAVPTGYSVLYSYDGCIVITGVYGIPSDGVYNVPEKIDGKKVIAIAQNAFLGVKDNVRAVILPSTVRVIWPNAFAGCSDLSNVYIRSKVIAIYPDAFMSVQNRNVTLTLNTSRDCRDFDYYYYKNISNKYGASYNEWNG